MFCIRYVWTVLAFSREIKLPNSPDQLLTNNKSLWVSKHEIEKNDIENLDPQPNINKYETQLFSIFNDILDTYFLTVTKRT